MEKQELLTALNTAKLGLGKNALIEVMNYFCFTGEIVYGYNDVIAAGAVLETDFVGAVEGKTLLRIIDTAPSDSVTIDEEKNSLKISSGRMKTKLAARGQDEFVFDFPDDDAFNNRLELAENFVDGIRAVLPTVPTSKLTREELSGVTVISSKSYCHFFASDVRTIAHHTGEALGAKFKLMLPRDFCIALIAMRKKFKGEAKPELMLADEFLQVVFDDGSCLFSKLPDVSLLDFKGHCARFEQDVDEDAMFEISDEFKSALNRAAAITTDDGGFVTLQAGSGKLEIAAESRTAKMEDTIDINDRHDEQTATFDIKHLKKALPRTDRMCITPQVLFMRGDGFDYIVAKQEA